MNLNNSKKTFNGLTQVRSLRASNHPSLQGGVVSYSSLSEMNDDSFPSVSEGIQMRSDSFDDYFHLRDRFIKRLMKDGKKSVATKVFDESLEIFYEVVQQTNEENFAKQTKSRKKSKDD